MNTYVLQPKCLQINLETQKIKTRLEHIGKSYLFDNVKCIPGPEAFKNKIKILLNDIYNQKWSSDRANNSVCQSYTLMTEKDSSKILQITKAVYLCTL